MSIRFSRSTTACIALVAGVSAVLSACTSPKVRIETIPTEASVATVSPAGDEKIIGPTPLELGSNTISKICAKEGMNHGCRIAIWKSGYTRESILIDESALTGEFIIKIKLKEGGAGTEYAKSDDGKKQFAEVANLTARILEQIFKGHYDAALDQASTFSTKYPNVSVAWDLMGNIYFLKKDLASAKKAYTRSLALDPTNTDIKNTLRTIEDGRAPSASSKENAP